MAASVLFVSVTDTFRPAMTLAELETCAERAWALTVAKAVTCDRVVAVDGDCALGAWRLRGAYPTDERYYHGERPRIALALGEALPVLRDYHDVPGLRRGCATAVVEVEPLADERVAVGIVNG